MKMIAHRLLKSTSGSSAAEFGLVLPLFLVLLFGVIDAGRFMWQSNEAEKATQIGARIAIVTDVLSSGLRDEDYAGKNIGGTTLAPGDLIPAAALGSMLCTSTGCSCETPPCPTVGTFNSALFNNVLVTRMKQMYPSITATNVIVRYRGSGFGLAEASGGGAGGPEQMEISPLVTVTLTNVQFRPLTTFALKSVTMPDFSTTLTTEDASGQYSN